MGKNVWKIFVEYQDTLTCKNLSIDAVRDQIKQAQYGKSTPFNTCMLCVHFQQVLERFVIIQYTSTSAIAGLILLVNLNTEQPEPETISTYTLCYDVGFQTPDELYDTYSGGFDAISQELAKRQLSHSELIECTRVTSEALLDRQSLRKEREV
ncbi:hypothetical protein LRP52_17990 [Photobacterium sp. ZSDE20]|uniref:Uncharacterized protein n=1 Tax=Photobacterium pectinilyticum TaxID=2906793 RepID=A0ABT1NA13_9GAMM|nr:hypothetical protein [Photobacterium sp. ZSDE20]MCQ1060704.1 hypothetical protein [Photobacterium sp. ZSDE20]MDD1824086.1 hypothetical protein [Photobacterium sp. ZSDE20]